MASIESNRKGIPLRISIAFLAMETIHPTGSEEFVTMR
ncbi:hypothetical protein SALIVB_0404 [Streptococcus salivarius CCHSS3]|jgi:hypothetical protein|nr:hypothetical protein Ssal_01789 [Streptococcus salivarius 57.I]CCB92712.1 hypothetical protein SALIVB_0404 [Streptococcus salivarius CCHSS3]CCB94723.1 hypothetical protein SALIVA_0385 [Streptococcus salivarius JIM8777]